MQLPCLDLPPHGLISRLVYLSDVAVLPPVPWYRLTIIIMVCGNSAIGSQTNHNCVRTIVSDSNGFKRFAGREIAGWALKRLRMAYSGSSDVLAVARYRRTASVLLVSWGV